MSDFPPVGFTTKEDSKLFTVEQDDPAIKVKAEGGFNMTRSRYKRRPRRSFTTGFTAISEANRLILENFWNEKKGGSLAFTWTIPTSGEEIQVRFAGPMRYKYVGQGDNFIWDVSNIKLREV